MATVTVTKQFKEDFDLWAAFVISDGRYTKEQIEGDQNSPDEYTRLGLKGILRTYELADGPDRLRDDIVHYTPEGEEKPSAIDDPKKRFALWASFFSCEADSIRNMHRKSE